MFSVCTTDFLQVNSPNMSFHDTTDQATIKYLVNKKKNENRVEKLLRITIKI